MTENPIFREVEHEKPTPLGLLFVGGLALALVVYVVWCGMYALLGGAL